MAQVFESNRFESVAVWFCSSVLVCLPLVPASPWSWIKSRSCSYSRFFVDIAWLCTSGSWNHTSMQLIAALALGQYANTVVATWAMGRVYNCQEWKPNQVNPLNGLTAWHAMLLWRIAASSYFTTWHLTESPSSNCNRRSATCRNSMKAAPLLVLLDPWSSRQDQEVQRQHNNKPTNPTRTSWIFHCMSVNARILATVSTPISGVCLAAVQVFTGCSLPSLFNCLFRL